MEVGEKYLSIVLLGQVKLAAFPNKKKRAGGQDPDFLGNGVAVWVNKKLPGKPAVKAQTQGYVEEDVL